jgi:uncharacterized protein YozE (UPF0346 family)
MKHSDPSQFADPKPNFARWLLQQMKRDDAIGELSRAAHGDRAFPIDGDFRAVSERLNKLQAEPDMHMALEDAELDWAAL